MGQDNFRTPYMADRSRPARACQVRRNMKKARAWGKKSVGQNEFFL
jgi:hypothetical protein